MAGADAIRRIPGRVLPRVQQPQERFLRLAFAAADLLLELSADGTIRFATGAFNTHFGAPASDFLGEAVERLIAPVDRPALAAQLTEAARRGRSAPIIVHLANQARTPMALAALASDDAPDGALGGLSVTLGRLPTPPSAAAEPSLRDPASFTREAEMRLSQATPASLSLLDVGRDGRAEPADDPRYREIAAALALAPELGADPLVATLAPGRFGVISRDAVDLAALCRRIEGLAGHGVRGAGFALAPGELGTRRAARAVRSALLSFAGGGVAGLAEAGFARGLDGFLEEAARRAATVRRLIARRRFRLLLQPVVSLADRTVQHYEALLRLPAAPGARATTTQEFVAFAEAANLSEELDAAVIEEALAQLHDAPGASVAVNLSGLSLQSVGFRERLLASVTRSSVRRGRLLVELTETAEIENIAAATGTLAALREAGVPVCLDDFGAGAAGFRYLRDFPVDFIKIDGTYLRAAMNGPRERAMLASMTALAHDVRAKVAVEMIETPEHEKLCRTIGADLGQGWLYGRPGQLPGNLRR